MNYGCIFGGLIGGCVCYLTFHDWKGALFAGICGAGFAWLVDKWIYETGKT